MTIQDVLAAASQLSQSERLQVAIQLLESFKESYITVTSLDDVDHQDQLAERYVDDEKRQTETLNTVAIAVEPLECSLHDLLSQSPLSRLDFETESIKSPVRVVEF